MLEVAYNFQALWSWMAGIRHYKNGKAGRLFRATALPRDPHRTLSGESFRDRALVARPALEISAARLPPEEPGRSAQPPGRSKSPRASTCGGARAEIGTRGLSERQAFWPGPRRSSCASVARMLAGCRSSRNSALASSPGEFCLACAEPWFIRCARAAAKARPPDCSPVFQ